MRKILGYPIGFSTLLAAALCGCGAGENGKIARIAETKGSECAAYEYYCKAAIDHRDSGDVIDGLRRTRAAAAAQWEKQAVAAIDAGRMDEAWRMLMRALDIQPDDDTAARLIRQIEREHGEQIATARFEYLRRGPATLPGAPREEMVAAAREAKRAPGESRADARQRTKPTQVATNSRGRRARARRPVQAPPPIVALEPTATEVPNEPANGDVPAEKPLDAANEIAKLGDAKAHEETPTLPEAGSLAEGAEGSAPKPEQPSEPVASPPRPNEKLKNVPSTSDSGGPAEMFSRTARGRPENVSGATPHVVIRRPITDLQAARGAFAMIRTMSKTDRTYPRAVNTLDGVTVRLKDTDSDPLADFDLSYGEKKFKKIRGLGIGESQTFAGRTGRLYRLTVLSIHHKSHTVRIGIRPF